MIRVRRDGTLAVRIAVTSTLYRDTSFIRKRSPPPTTIIGS